MLSKSLGEYFVGGLLPPTEIEAMAQASTQILDANATAILLQHVITVTGTNIFSAVVTLVVGDLPDEGSIISRYVQESIGYFQLPSCLLPEAHGQKLPPELRTNFH